MQQGEIAGWQPNSQTVHRDRQQRAIMVAPGQTCPPERNAKRQVSSRSSKPQTILGTAMTGKDEGPECEPMARQPMLQPVPSRASTSPEWSFSSGLAGSLNGQRTWLLLAGFGVLFVAAIVLTLTSFESSTKSVGPQKQDRVAVGASMIRPVAAAETDKAIGLLMMSDAEKATVRTELAKGKLRIGWITVSDTMDEDGDWVRIAAAGLQQDVRLFNRPYTMAVPYLPGMPVSVIGLIDGGGGGITVAVYVGSAKLPLKPMQKGEVVQIPVP